tara:strand:- start:897 stop:2690 length:1794 start_codon:yes stop_codon:yes gene_type:complete
MSNKKPAIDYTSRDFTSLKLDLVNYARRYYPDQFRDFTANSFGSLMLDTVSYVGDILSFYLDYQTNESFLSTAIDYNNILKLARQFGYKPRLSPSSYGVLTFFLLIPSTNGTPDYDYAPILKRGSVFRTGTGNLFTLLEDINFADVTKTETVVGDVDSATGVPTSFAVRARGQAVSGELNTITIEVGEYEKFRRLPISDSNITEIVSVVDSEGNVYTEVDYLTQNTIYVPIINRNEDRTTVANILKPISVPRRFVVEKEQDQVILQFGFGTNEDEERIINPSNVIIEQHGKQYISDDSFDPAALIKTDRLGVSPSDTVLVITYRVNSAEDTNASVGIINQIVDPLFEFNSSANLLSTSIADVRSSLEVINEEAFIGDVPFPDSQEIKTRAFGAYSMQNRIVTKQDFMAAAYGMPSKFGAIKKVNVLQDSDSFNQRNINMYVLSEDSIGDLTIANNTIKNNLKTWLSRYKMINDTIDILDANIINLQIGFKVVSFPDTNKFSSLQVAKDDLQSFFVNRNGYDIGEPFSITDIYAVLKNSLAILDVIEVNVEVLSGGVYSDSNFSVAINKSGDGRKIFCPEDSCFEIKFPDSDIIGTIV